MPGLRLSDLLHDRLQADSEKPAFIQGSEVITIAGFCDLINRTTAWLKKNGIGADDVVALWLVNRVEWLAVFFALSRLGALAVSVNTRYRSDELEQVLARTRARMLITHHQHRQIDFIGIAAMIAPDRVPYLEKIAIIECGHLSNRPACAWKLIDFDVALTEPCFGEDASDPEKVAILFSTSGTTKAPKLVMHPQRTLVDHARRCAQAYRLDAAGSCLLCMLPLCGVFGLNSVLAGFAAGIPVVLQETFYASSGAALLVKHEVTHTFGSDEMYQRLGVVSSSEHPFPSARFFGFGAFTSSFSELAKECWRRGMPLHGLYGSSEVLALFSAQPGDLPLEQKIEGGGYPVAGAEAEIRIRDTATGALLPAGASGEIEIKAPNMFIGYYQDPEATAKAMFEGYFKTGDLGYMRDDGTFVFEARLGDVMRLGGYLVNPVEIEEALKGLPDISDAHVVAATIASKPKAVAFVIPADGCSPTQDSIARRLRQHIADFKLPARVWLVDKFPQTEGANGNKTSRTKLRELAQWNIDAEGCLTDGGILDGVRIQVL